MYKDYYDSLKKFKICTSCKQEKTLVGLMCDKCTLKHKKRAKKLRSEPKNCKRCGNKKDDKEFLTCTKCRIYSHNYHKKTYERNKTKQK